MTVAQLEWGMKHISGMSNQEKGEKNSKKKENEYLKADWTKESLNARKGMLLSVLSKAVTSALQDMQTKLEIPVNFKDELSQICPVISKQNVEAAKTKIDALAAAMKDIHDHNEKDLNYRPIDLSKFVDKDAAVVQSALISKLIFLLLKIIKKSKADAVTNASNPTKYDSADLRFMQRGLRFYSNQIRLIDEALNPKAASPVEPKSSDMNDADGVPTGPPPVDSMAKFGTGVFSMGRPYK